MSIRISTPGDFRDDYGTWERVYPVPTAINPQSMIYDSDVQKVSYNLANMVAVFDEWFRSFFDPNYFTFTRIKSQSTFSEFKSFMKQIYKKDKPFLVIDPETIELVDDFIYAQNMLNRYNVVDPKNEKFGAKLMYSKHILHDEMCELMYRRNRYRFEFNILIMEQTMDRQLNTFNKLIMDIRHNSKFMIYRTLPMLIPIKYITNIAGFHGYDYKSEEFLRFINTISEYPIIRRVTPNGKFMFFFNKEVHIQIEVPNFPQKDSPETSGAIEWGARITDTFYFIVDMPSEYLFILPEEYERRYDSHINEDPDKVNYILPYNADSDFWETSLGAEKEYKITNKVDIMVEMGDDNHFDTKLVVANDYPDIHSEVIKFIKNGFPINDIMQIRVYENGCRYECKYTLDDQGIVTIINPTCNQLYTVLIYVNFHTINLIREGRTKEFIGDIQQSEYGIVKE